MVATRRWLGERAERAAAWLVLAAMSGATHASGATPPVQIADIDTRPPFVQGDGLGGAISSMRSLGDQVLFLTTRQHDIPYSYDRRVEVGLWRTDGSLAGTRLLRVFQGIDGDFPCVFLAVQSGRGVLWAGDELWATDGTPEGTVPLLPAGVRFSPLTYYGSELQLPGPLTFLGCDDTDARSCRLWSTDGTVAGTQSLGNVPLPDNTADIVVLGGRKYWFVSGALVTTDGTPAGTRVVIDLGVESRARSLVATADRLFFVTGDRAVSLWSSDGSSGGTKLVGRVGNVYGLVGAAHRIYFDDYQGDRRSALGTSDGTAAGTLLLTPTIDFSATNFALRLVGTIGDRLLFSAAGGKLWASDGTRTGTLRLKGCPGGCPVEPELRRFQAVPAGEAILFLASRTTTGRELWRSDGTAAGTRQAADLCPGTCDGYTDIRDEQLGGRTLLQRRTRSTQELWISDLAPAGTRLLLTGETMVAARLGSGLLVASTDRDDHRLRLRRLDANAVVLDSFEPPFAESRGSFPNRFVALGDRVVFAGCDAGGTAVFASDGTPEGTLRLGAGSDYCSLYDVRFLRFGEAVYYTVEGRLYRTDGSPQGTTRVAIDFEVKRAWVFGERLVLVATEDRDDNGYDDVARIYLSDGTAAGTHALATVALYEVCTAQAVGSRLYFTASVPDPDGRLGGLYVLDGNAETVTKLLTLDRYHQCGDDELVAIGERAFLHWGGQLWRTEGTRDSTQQVVPSTLTTAASVEGPLGVLGSHLYFLASLRGDANYGRETFLYRTNGTSLGTVPMAAVGNLHYDDTPSGFTTVGGKLFFRASDLEHGDELWVTDGTTAGTRLVADIAPGAASSRPLPLGSAGGRFYFMADDGEHGIEPWSSDGTAAGTAMVADLAPDGFSSWPSDVAAAGDHLFFGADDGRAGSELWALPLEIP